MAREEGEQSLFLEFFGDTPRFRIMDFLLDNRLMSYTKKEIAEGAGVSWASLFNHWEELEKNGVVKVARKVGRVRLYQLDDSSPIVRQLRQIEWVLINRAADEAEEEASLKVRARQRSRS